MAVKDFKTSYKTIMDDHFPPAMEISFVDGKKRQTLVYEKVSWLIDGVNKGLRYGENPGQEAALYKLINGNLLLGEVTSIQPGRTLASDVELLQSGKHPGKTNITDVDNALNILRYLMETPCAVIVKHNNPCGVAKSAVLAEAYAKANLADRVAAFGGAIVLNRDVDRDTAELVLQNYAEVVAAPGFAPGVLELFATKKNLRVMRIANIARLESFACERVVDFKSLVDGGIIAQWSFTPVTRTRDQLAPAQAVYKGKEYKINRMPTEPEYADLLFGWLIECGVTSNSVLYVKDGVTISIGAGGQDRVGMSQFARDKAYRNLADRLCWEQHQIPYNNLQDESSRAEIDKEVARCKGGLPGSGMVSDAFFPFRDGVEVGLREGVSAVIQPGGSDRDFESIEACNEVGAAMVFTGQRCFKH
ncbi:MAG: IMP cyclohydrolase [Verrucomicrobia bacterium]|nr:IMP cyclohydrolase [Verrucomicrobiota bacterium]MBU4247856.1 IMP cyclohydrolase [Verrucomicrobiota bacterium]MBU4290851.1 IMP cyclohydrolase [Verrucomicrobiota bacterium]MBU4496519.1 IMP cyclohydrolase [Verrucomicrobiota bacterium]MCG2681233.1 IMP cyclohydrolase [Kiritimatiellia bacterium]